ncbi:sigma factor [Oenococcus kitaharae]|uniref:ComX-like protein n=1 Tax=Oenococcus kitaharae DSM 17330 TaxID=1045004 RepID=G9WGR5_9LACO|nr:sigma factor [Oenococcus kitaharae]EHN59892.1 ComX-like protein [Oenococcus kitaharae DSM 17330]MCV3296663.1 sigma-70 family RNA polymerase sigma factor [Oenococcus kitaharae]OEY82083.1 competence protein ComX [Oenococcus kitaharae]OEY82462.1 competence protein ComX [Oenococcus kitaharae]OEY83796.1 competence protein ComX [Oenococcus kitaharae]
MRIEKALNKISQGDETGYEHIILVTKGLVRKIYYHYLSNVLELDDWESECLTVLMHAVRRYHTNGNCKFTTYYYAALQHKAMDLLRKSYSKKEQNRRQNVSLEELAFNGYDPVDHGWNQAQTKMDFEDAISQTDFRAGDKESLAIKELFGDLKQAQIVQKQVKAHSLDYRKKRVTRDIYAHFYGLGE